MRDRSFVLLGAAAGVALVLAVTSPQIVFTGADARPAPATAATKRQLLGFFVGALERVRTHYVERPDDSGLIHSAINGMLSGLENSSFMDGDAIPQSVCTGPECAIAGGTGMEIVVADGVTQVVSPLDGSPAAKAGVMARDIIEEVDAEPIQNMSINEIFDKLKGERGQKIRLKLARAGHDKSIDVAFARDVVSKQSVTTRLDGGDVAYVRVSRFHEDTADEFKKSLADITAQIGPGRLKGFVLDLRNNPGGLLDGAVSVADALLDAGEIVSIHGRKTAANEHLLAKPGDLAEGKPIVILINAGSASAAEIVAGALKDNHRATVVGTRSFGKGSVPTVVPIGPGRGALTLTTGHYFTPSGRQITGNGILPDVEALQQNVPEEFKTDSKSKDKEHATLQSYVPPDPKADSALTLAYDLLRGTKTAH